MTDLPTGAAQLRALHQRGRPLVLVNAWDVGSARHVAAAGARAVATSSSAISESLGLPDNPTAPVEPLFAAIGRIAAAVDVPVTADVLDGYGLDADELVDRLLAAGAVGCNVEDSDHAHPGSLLDPAVAAERIAAVRAAARRAGVDLVVNARVDSYARAAPDAGAEVTEDAVARGRRYLEAGADCVYPIRLTDPARVREVVGRIDGPVNVNVGGGVTVAELAAAGASRISIGSMAYRRALATVDQLAAELLAPLAGGSS
jgi:2-methylisocitrate lyase-like PEP mutase family enzyme